MFRKELRHERVVFHLALSACFECHAVVSRFGFMRVDVQADEYTASGGNA
jgi:hypothetical protein